MTWRYFGRTGGTGAVRGIYRMPSEGYDGTLDLPHFDAMELLRPDGRWIVQSDLPLTDWHRGRFNAANEISADRVRELVEKWNAKGWPDSKG